jgi:hypothetical protein
MAPVSQELEPPANPGRFMSLLIVWPRDNIAQATDLGTLLRALMIASCLTQVYARLSMMDIFSFFQSMKMEDCRMVLFSFCRPVQRSAQQS